MGALTSSIISYRRASRSSSHQNLNDGPRREPPPPPLQVPHYVSTPVEELHKDFINSVYVLLLNHSLFWQRRRKDAPIHFKKPEELRKLIDCELREAGVDQLQLLLLLRKIIYYSPTSGHPYYMYSPLAGLDPYSLIGDFVASVVPSTMLSYRDGPVYNLMEKAVSKKLCQLAGYPEGTGDCIFPCDSSIANVFSILLARHQKFPECKEKGTFHLPPLVVFVSQDCSSSFQKGAIYAGIGSDNIISIKTDVKGKMSIMDLVKRIEGAMKVGKIPLMVGATSGSSYLGAFDSLEDVSKVCKKYGMWLHSDGALGGGIIFSSTERGKRLKGMELCDSFTGDFHQLGSASQASTFMITPHTSILSEVFGLHRECQDHSSYNSTFDHFHPEQDTFEKYIDPNRRPDIVKLFMMWKGKGLHGLGANIDSAYERTRFFLGELKRRQKREGKFVPLLDDFESPLITFYYIPTYLHNLERTAAQFKERLDIHTSFMLAELINNGIMVLTVQSLRQSPLFFKILLYNSSLTNKDLTYLLDQLENCGSYLRIPFETPAQRPY